MKRRELREHTFKLVFMKEFYEPDVLESQVNLYLESEELAEYTDQEKEILKKRAEQVLAVTEEVDELINRYAKGWQTRRMAKVDLSLIRLAIFEIRHDPDVPAKVAINEAVELAKKFGQDGAGAFVNAVLAKFV